VVATVAPVREGVLRGRSRPASIAAAFAVATAVVFGGNTSGAQTAAVAASSPPCARSTGGSSQQQAPTAGRPCWTEVQPYPFGANGDPVDLSSEDCRTRPSSCALLNVTSLAFRAWNRGLAATATNVPGASNPLGVWLYNGARWFPDPTFPGSRACPGNTVLWAGKLDYWLIGTPTGNWVNLCRFDGSQFVWEPLPLPTATVARGKALDKSIGNSNAGTTGITSGTCLAWDDCWFFGTYGTVVHWDGVELSDDSPPVTLKPWLGTEFTGATLQAGAGGTPLGVAVGSSNLGSARNGTALPSQPGGTPPPQLFTFDGSGWSPTSFSPPATPQPSDPFRTDLVGVSLQADGHGWAAGNPAGRRAGAFPPFGRAVVTSAEPSPLVPVNPQGDDPSCGGPPTSRFAFAAGQDSYLWSSIAAVPGTGDAIAGGQVFPGGGPTGEPVLVQASCDGRTSVTRFELALAGRGTVPANGAGWIEAVAANAANDAWAATSFGTLDAASDQPARLYHLTDGQKPQAPAGDDAESRPLQLQLDPPIIVFAPLPPVEVTEPAPVVESTTTQTQTTTQTPARTRRLPPAISNVHSKVVRKVVRRKVHGLLTGFESFRLNLTFKVRRPVTLGLRALRKNHVVATASLRKLRPPSGKLVLEITRKTWPTKLEFVTDTPTGMLANPGPVLSGTVTLRATARAIDGRKVRSVRFEYSVTGADAWTTIATAGVRPFSIRFDTSSVQPGSYDLRAVITDSAGVSGVTPVLGNRRIQSAGGK